MVNGKSGLAQTAMAMTSNKPAVSVIIPAYNTAAYIGETLASVFAQTYRAYEVLVINDGSDDTPALEAVLAPYGARIRYVRQANGGASNARNTGVRLARGTYVAFLDSDDCWLPDFLSAQVSRLEEDPQIAVSYANAWFFGETPLAGRDYMSLLPSTGAVTLSSLVEQRCNVLGVVARRSALEAAGLFDESLSTAEDFDLWLRLVAQGWRIVYDRQPRWRYRKRGGSLTDTPLVGWQNYLRVLEKAKRTLPLTTEDRQVIERRCAYINGMLNLYAGKQAFLAGEPATALDLLARANTTLNSRKLVLVMRLLRLAPQLLLRAYQMRDRLVYGTNTKL
jgi:glycosyltransferase involved in cell wall biosynthesis